MPDGSDEPFSGVPGALGRLIDEAMEHAGDLAPPKTFLPMTGRDQRWAGPDKWFENRRKDDDVVFEGRQVWRIHDDLYDLTDFAERHPGGAWWIRQTQGLDVTESFEISHPDIAKARALLAKYHLGKATKPRISPLTFHKDGFFATFRRRALPVIKSLGDYPKWKTNRIADGFLLTYLGLWILANRRSGWKSYLSAAGAGAVLGLMAIVGHNYYHQRDNWRMLFGNLAGSSYIFGRQTHSIGHHQFVNSYWDPETHFAEPRFPLLPSSERTPRQFKKFWHGAPFYLLVGPLGSLFRLKNLLFNPTFRKNANAADFLPWLMFLIGLAIKKNPVKALPLWAVMQGFATFTLLTIASTTSHNKPDEERGPWHQGDPNMPTDFGLYHLEATTDRVEAKGSAILALCTFGDHTLHHLLPTVDHGYLPYLYPVLEQTCKDFGVDLGFQSWADTVRGFDLALNRTTPLKENNRVRLGDGVTDRLLDPKITGSADVKE